MNSINPEVILQIFVNPQVCFCLFLSETTETNNPWGGLTYVPSGGSMGSSNGVPSHANGWTWTFRDSWTNHTSLYWEWGGLDTDDGSYNGNGYVSVSDNVQLYAAFVHASHTGQENWPQQC